MIECFEEIENEFSSHHARCQTYIRRLYATTQRHENRVTLNTSRCNQRCCGFYVLRVFLTFSPSLKSKKGNASIDCYCSQEEKTGSYQALLLILNELLVQVRKSKCILHFGGCNNTQNELPSFLSLRNAFSAKRTQPSRNFFPNNGAPQAPVRLENVAGPNALQMQGGVIAGGARRVGQNGNCDIHHEDIPDAPCEEIANVQVGQQVANNRVATPPQHENFGDANMPVEAVLQGEHNNAHQVPNVAPVAVAGMPVAAVLQGEHNNAHQVANVAPVVVAAIPREPIVEDDFTRILNGALEAVMDVMSPEMRRLAIANANAAFASSENSRAIARMQRELRPEISISGVIHYVTMMFGITTALSGISSSSAALGNLMSNNGAVAAAPVGENRRVWEFTGAFASVLGTGMARVVSQVASHVATSITQPNLPGNPQQAPQNGQ